MHAPTFLLEYIESFLRLDILPDDDDIIGLGSLSEIPPNQPPNEPSYTDRGNYIKKRLLEDYGWPKNFRARAWAGDIEEIWREASAINDVYFAFEDDKRRKNNREL
jgi:hypothetical protein